MFKIRRIFVFGIVLALVGAQRESAAEPRQTNAQKLAGSYSDFPGRFQNLPQINSPNAGRPRDTSRYTAVKSNNGPINIPGSSSSYSAFRGIERPPKPPAAANSYSEFQANAVPANKPVKTNSRSATPNRGGKGVSFSTIAASELAQGKKKDRPPISTGTDTWTPMGHLGTGKPWNPVPTGSSQQLPYDTSQSKVTIAEQIKQQLQKKQQQEQQQQQYDIFGFPINNSDPFADLFGFTSTTDPFASFTPSPDPFFGIFEGATGGSNQGGLGSVNHSGSRTSGGHGPGGEFLQMMLMMQLLGGGADTPDPPPRGRGRGRGAGAAIPTPLSALEQLMHLEQIRLIRNRQRERVDRNRRLPENRRGSQLRNRPGQSTGKKNQQSRQTDASSPFDIVNNIPRPPRPSSTVLRPNSSPRRPNTHSNSFHPEVLDRRNMPTTQPPVQSGQEPVEREGQRQGQTMSQEQRQTQPPAQPREFGRRVSRISNTQIFPPARSGNNIGYQSINSYQNPIQGPYKQNNNPLAIGGPRNRQRFQGQNAVPRNMQQLMNNNLFQRRLRVAGAPPGSNSADVRADQADLMADRADNLQSMNPLQRLFNAGMFGGQGPPGRFGIQTGQRGARATGFSVSPALGLSSLPGNIGAGGLLASMLGGGKSNSELIRKPEHPVIAVHSLDTHSPINRHRRQAIVYDGTETFHDHSSHFHPPKPPQEMDIPLRNRRPPPPPTIEGDLFNNQLDTSHQRPKTHSRYSNIKQSQTTQPVYQDNKPVYEGAKPAYKDTQSVYRGAKPIYQDTKSLKQVAKPEHQKMPTKYPDAILQPHHSQQSEYLGVQSQQQQVLDPISQHPVDPYRQTKADTAEKLKHVYPNPRTPEPKHGPAVHRPQVSDPHMQHSADPYRHTQTDAAIKRQTVLANRRTPEPKHDPVVHRPQVSDPHMQHSADPYRHTQTDAAIKRQTVLANRRTPEPKHDPVVHRPQVSDPHMQHSADPYRHTQTDATIKRQTVLPNPRTPEPKPKHVPVVHSPKTEAPVMNVETAKPTVQSGLTRQPYASEHPQTQPVDRTPTAQTVTGNRHYPTSGSPKAPMHTEASLNIGTLLDDTNVGHTHEHVHSTRDHNADHTHSVVEHEHVGNPHTNSEAPIKPVTTMKVKPTTVKAKPTTMKAKPSSSKQPIQQTIASQLPQSTPGSKTGKQGHFMSMFDAWYKAKFESAKTQPSPVTQVPTTHVTESRYKPRILTGQPVKLKPVTPNPNAAVKGDNIREMILRSEGVFQRPGRTTQRRRYSEPTLKTLPPTTGRPNLFRQRQTVNRSQQSATVPSGKTQASAANAVDKQALFQEFMLMYQNQIPGGAPRGAPEPLTKRTKPVQVTKKPIKQTTHVKTTVAVPKLTTISGTTNPGHVELITLSHPETFAPIQAPANAEAPPQIPPEGTPAPVEAAPPNPEGAPASGEAPPPKPEGTPAAGEAPPPNAEGATAAAEAPLPKAAPAPPAAPTTPIKTPRPKPSVRTTTVRPTIDPDLLSDINEARMGQGLPLLNAHQVDLQGNLLPFYQRKMRIGRLPARPHPLHNPVGMKHHHQHHQPQHNVLDTLTSLFQARAPHGNNDGHMMQPLQRRHHPLQRARKYNLYNPNSPGNSMQGPRAFDNGLSDPNAHGLDNIDLHHQAIHMEAGNNLNPHLHRQIHRLLRQRQQAAAQTHRNNLYVGMQNPSPTAQPILDPDILADLLDAAAAANPGHFG